MRYEVEGEIARGGMGRVLAATDRVLGRPVALKTIRGPKEELDERFNREMRITARLQHPAIVPIYDAGQLPSGEPFYAMRMISGRPLDRAIAEAKTLSDRMALLPAVITVARAVAYAHDEGVIHRDLKPQNVIVGPFGETVVLDWGLAKDLRAAEPEPEAVTFAVGSGTQAGEVLGTPAYMAPEQLDGAVADERSDVYGLGGILYQLMTGVPPHEGPVATGELRPERVVPVGRREPEVPAELAAIIDRALAPDPAARYASAAELAADLERYQAGALVGAHRYSLGERLRKWIARHRAAVLVGVVSFGVIVVLSVIALQRILAERDRAERERDRAAAQRDAAEKLVGFMLTDLRARLENVGRIDVLEPVGKEVDAYYAKLPPRDGADLRRRAAALAVLGDARIGAGDLDGALDVNRRGVSVAQASGDDDVTCRAHQRVGDVHKARGELAEAAAAYQACADLARARGWPALLASSLAELGALARIRADHDGAVKLLEESLDAAGKVGGDEGALLRIKIHDELALIAIDRGDLDRAAKLVRENADRARADADAHPDDPSRRRTWSTTLTQLARVELHRGDLAAAEKLFRETLEVSRALVALDPSNTEWLRDVSIAEDFLGTIALERGDLPEALAHMDASQDISKRLHRMDAKNSRVARDVVAGEINTSMVLRQLGRNDEARARIRGAIELGEPLAKANPDNGDLAVALAICWLHLGDAEVARKDLAAARAALDESARQFRAMIAKQDAPSLRQHLTSGLLLLNEIDPTGPHLDEAVALVEPLRKTAGDDAALRETIAEVDAVVAKRKR